MPKSTSPGFGLGGCTRWSGNSYSKVIRRPWIFNWCIIRHTTGCASISYVNFPRCISLQHDGVYYWRQNDRLSYTLVRDKSFTFAGLHINVSATIFKTAVAFGCSRQIMACGNSALVRSPSQMTEMNPGPSDCLLSIAYCVDPGTSR